MKYNREFEIAWQGLKPGPHHYSFAIDDRFMAEHQAPAEFHDWNAAIKLTFDKQSSFFRLHFDISGSVVTPCDRCGDDFKLDLWDEFDLLLKLTGEPEDELHEPDEEADVAFIPRSETVIDISNWIYEFVMLAIPLQRIHPDHADGAPGCNPLALKLLNQLSGPEAAPEHDIWKGLKNLTVEEEQPTTTNKRKTK